jgi:protein required for attachment to host cells
MEYASDPLAEKLAVFAKHDMLGHLRQLMPKSLQERVIREVPKNFLHLPAQELVEVFAREVRDGTDLS